MTSCAKILEADRERRPLSCLTWRGHTCLPSFAATYLNSKASLLNHVRKMTGMSVTKCEVTIFCKCINNSNLSILFYRVPMGFKSMCNTPHKHISDYVI